MGQVLKGPVPCAAAKGAQRPDRLARNTEQSRRRAGTKQDFITLLWTAPGHTASKHFIKSKAGVEKVNFNAGYYFTAFEPTPVGSIFELSNILSAIEAIPNMMVIRGLPREPALIGKFVRRLGSGDIGNFFTPSEGHHWILIDLDKIPLPRSLSLTESPEAVCEYLIGLLPHEFSNATYHWQLSSSAGIGDLTVASVHMWFWLKAPIPDQELKRWANHVNDLAGYKLVDPALFQHVQAHYTASPTFVGMDDPFPTRSGLHVKARDTVALVISAPTKKAAASRAIGATPARTHVGDTGASGFEYHLSRIGDHPGGDGFHGPIVAAAASYVCEHGEESTDPEHVYKKISEAVEKADSSNHDDATVAARASREQIMPAIESAIKKYGSQPSSRRKARLVEGIQPHFKSSPVSIDVAQEALTAFAKRAR